MDGSAAVENLAARLRALALSGSPDLEACVESYLEQELREVPLPERLPLLERLCRQFEKRPGGGRSIGIASEESVRLLSRLLGREVGECSAADLTDRFADSLKTIFDTLNSILGVIHTTLLGKGAQLETIRRVIGANIEDERDDTSLKLYLEQIQQAFLTSHQAFQQAAETVFKEMLAALDPAVLEASVKPGMKFGPLRKAELYELYEVKFQQGKQWVESGRFRDNLLREFEKICQKQLKS
jgi:hypothetical protein